MIIYHSNGTGEEMGLIAQSYGSLQDKVFQPRRGVLVALNVEIGIADHIGQQESLDLLERTVILPFLGEVARTVQAVAIRPLLHRLFPIGPEQPHAVTIAFLAAQLIGDFEQNRGGRPSIVRPNVSRVAQRVIRVVVARNDYDAVLRARILGDDIADWEFPLRRVGGEAVVFDLVTLEMGNDVLLQLFMIGAADRARSEGHNFLNVLHGARGIHGKSRSDVRRSFIRSAHYARHRFVVADRGIRIPCLYRVVVAVAGKKRQ